MCVRLQNTLFHYCNLVCVYWAYLKKECGIILYQEWNAVIEVWSFWSATLERISYEVDNCCLHFSYQQLKLFAWWGICRVSNIEERRQDLIRTAGGHLRWINLNLLNLKEDWQEAGEKENNMYTKNIFSSSDRIYILNLFKTEFETYSYVKHYNIETRMVSAQTFLLTNRCWEFLFLWINTHNQFQLKVTDRHIHSFLDWL